VGNTASTADQAKPRLLGLDLLRLLAVVLVLGRHLWRPPESLPDTPEAVFATWRRGGWVGVDLFFVLSGFLVSGLLFSEYKARGQFSVGRFYTRRGWKIYPAFFALIAVTMVFHVALDEPYGRRQVASELVFLQSYVRGLWNHTWSLAVEEHFYILLPLTLALMLRINRGSPAPFKPLVALAACVAIGALVLRLLNWHYRSSYSNLTHSFPSHLRLDSLFFGVAISYAYHFHTDWFVGALTPWRRWLVVGGALLLTPAFVLRLETTPFIYTAGFTLFYIGSGMLLVGVLLSDLPRNRLVAGLGALGAYSYSIYLWHMPVNEWGISAFERVWGEPVRYGVRAAVYVFGSLVLGVVMAKAIEVPALRLRDKWFPPRTVGPLGDRPDPAAPDRAHGGLARSPVSCGTPSLPGPRET
jgi:peptidoglycan/LPS O-acetylase OafA/YrhL